MGAGRARRGSGDRPPFQFRPVDRDSVPTTCGTTSGKSAALVEGRPILAVIKNNAYGMGLLNMARILESETAVIGMAVVKLSEALELRGAGIAKPVLLMGPFDDADLEAAVMRGRHPRWSIRRWAMRSTGWRPGGSRRCRSTCAWTPGWAGSGSRTGGQPG